MIIFTFIRFRFKFPFRFSIVASFLLAKSQNDYLLISSNQYITSHSGLITQCDINEYEALVTLYFNNEKRTTVTNQHGQYRFLNDKNLSQDIEQITSLRSRYLLAWGNQTVNECNKYERFHGECINFGSLIASYTKKSENNSGIFGVILNGSNLREANFALIRMASELSFVSGLKYVIRLHPADDYNYSSLLNSGCISVKVYNDECYFELVDFSMSHSSGLFITNLPSNNKILLYKDELLPEVYRSSELCFSNISELNTILSNYESFHQTEVTKFVCKYNEERMLGHISDLFIKS